jgi:molecular chaperone GrpE
MSEKRKIRINDLEPEQNSHGGDRSDRGDGNSRTASPDDPEQTDVEMVAAAEAEPEIESPAATETVVVESDEQGDVELQLARMTENWQRERASFLNYKKRIEEEKSNIRKYACYDLAYDLLKVIDYFESSISFSENLPGEAKSVIDGVEYTLKELTRVLSAHGVRQIAVKAGDTYESAVMEAVERRESVDDEPGTIVEVQRSGWQLHDRVLRPAQVVVAVAPEAPENE